MSRYSKYSRYWWTEILLFLSVMVLGTSIFIAVALWLYCKKYIGTVGYYSIGYGGEFLSIGLAGLCTWKYGLWRINKYYGKAK